MPTLRPALLLTAALGFALPAAAQQASQEPDDILVTGQREAVEVDRGEVRSQARAVTPRGTVEGEPLARFQDPICPGVWGLSTESAQYIIDRIYHNAEAAGLELDETAGCGANAIVIFVDEPHAEFADMARHSHILVNPLSFWEKKRVSDTEGPVLAWNVVATRTSGGQDRSGHPPVFEATDSTRLTSGTRRDIQASVIMFDTDLLEDLDGLALADYATMRLLARTRPVDNGDAAYGTILSLFDDPVRAPQSMTTFDRAYLASLYDSRAELRGNLALRDVGQRMEEAAE
jgi:hypothetical protein